MIWTLTMLEPGPDTDRAPALAEAAHANAACLLGLVEMRSVSDQTKADEAASASAAALAAYCDCVETGNVNPPDDDPGGDD